MCQNGDDNGNYHRVQGSSSAKGLGKERKEHGSYYIIGESIGATIQGTVPPFPANNQ